MDELNYWKMAAVCLAAMQGTHEIGIETEAYETLSGKLSEISLGIGVTPDEVMFYIGTYRPES